MSVLIYNLLFLLNFYAFYFLSSVELWGYDNLHFHIYGLMEGEKKQIFQDMNSILTGIYNMLQGRILICLPAL